MRPTYRATIMQTPERHRLDVLRNVGVEVDDHGEIVLIEAAGPDADADVVLPSTTVLIPGLVRSRRS